MVRTSPSRYEWLSTPSILQIASNSIRIWNNYRDPSSGTFNANLLPVIKYIPWDDHSNWPSAVMIIGLFELQSVLWRCNTASRHCQRQFRRTKDDASLQKNPREFQRAQRWYFFFLSLSIYIHLQTDVGSDIGVCR